LCDLRASVIDAPRINAGNAEGSAAARAICAFVGIRNGAATEAIAIRPQAAIAHRIFVVMAAPQYRTFPPTEIRKLS
jgi:hypothetical protein